MHPLATDMIVKQVFQRRDEGDCPSSPAKPAGVLEDVIIDLASRLQAGRSGNYEDRHNGPMVMHPISDISDLDDVCRELGIQDSPTTPAEAVRELNGEIERLRSELAKHQWRTMESAPLTGLRVTSETLLLAHASKKWIRFGKWYVQERCWYYSGTNERSQWAQVKGDAPTHWQPLPAAPEAP